ncbi:MAG TPA: DUF4340 domain-containing protein [Sedimentisphaerales bacterium]|nr:DUF4340 domain-containing protein [Sedimentisphaerales bacterium]HRS09898.1 DUF4340 domain-containing protein [Sedimentisphaerales bacterium]HRV46452.1 DUF4340 domain-containing protein [Sedimentisphaerales bacterium]
MSNRNLGILAVVAAIMVVWAVVQSRLSSQSVVKPSGPSYLIQGLDPSQIGSIVVGHGANAVTIQRRDQQFRVVNKADYPADPKRINDLITKCLDIKTLDAYTSNAKNHEDLEVTEEKAHGVVKFLRADGSVLTGVIIGKSVENGQNTYVRLASQDTVYLAESAPYIRSTAIDYVNQEIVSVKREDVNSVTVTTPDGSYTLRSAEGDAVVMADLPDDKKLKDSDAKSVLGALNSLRFDDVNTPSAAGELSFDYRYVCRLDDSTEYRFQIARKDGKAYVVCDAEFTDKTPVTMKPGQVESQEELKKKEAKLQAQERAQRFTLRHKDWVYQIPEWKANYLTKRQADLVEDRAKPAAEKPAATPAESSPPAAAAQPPVPEPATAPDPAPAQSADPNAG